MATNVVEKLQSQVEVWKNTSPGAKWYICFDLQGRETSKVVEGNRTFTLTTFERQINQDRAATAEQDLFRNGTFVLSKPSSETNPEEVSSPNAKTDGEIEGLVREIEYGDLKTADAIAEVDSPVTLQRLYDALKEAGAHHAKLNVVKKKIDSITNAPVEREVVMTAPEEG